MTFTGRARLLSVVSGLVLLALSNAAATADLPKPLAVPVEFKFRTGAGDVTIDEKIGCSPHVVHVPAFVTGRAPSEVIEWRQSTDYVSSVLPNGGRLVIQLPSICRRVRAADYLPGFVPLVYSIDNARSPSLVEAIVYETAYEQGTSSELKFLGMKVSPPEEVETPIAVKPAGRIPDKYQGGFLGVDQTGKHVSRGFDWILEGVTAYIYPRAVWSKHLGLARHLETVSGVALIPWDVVNRLGVSSSFYCDHAQVGASRGARCTSEFDSRPHAVPLSRDGDTWIVSRRQFGIERLHVVDRYDPAKFGCTIQPHSCSFEHREFKIQIAGRIFVSTIQRPTFWVFDQAQQEVFFIYPAIFPAILSPP